ncbi:phage integrase [Mycobacteroides abscessus subsp. abscessus]|nr:phage integrase [Mycobacteroides abscessus subsp. abscessus]
MPSLTKQANGTYLARYRYDGKQHARRFKSEREAKAWLEQVTSDKVMGTFVEPGRSKVPLRTVAEAWLENPSWKASTRARNESAVRAYILPKWGSKPLNAIEFEMVQKWVVALSNDLSANTVKKIVGVLHGILELAVKTRRIANNPVKGVALPKGSLAPRRYLTPDQVEALAEAADEHSLIVYVLAYCGLRFGELAGLRVEDVDLMRRRFRIEHSVTEVNGKLDHSSPKDHQRRSVPFPAFLDEEIRALVAGRDLGESLFTSPKGGVLRVRNVRRSWFDVAAKTAGLDGLTPHELRHTAASMAIAAGATPLGVQRMLGHEKASMTLDTYSDLFDRDLDDVAERLSNFRSRAREIKMRSISAANPGNDEAQAF